jgi:diguanylate cyclase (GGDEF)-like protein/PAS domain S-box-containing protein
LSKPRRTWPEWPPRRGDLLYVNKAGRELLGIRQDEDLGTLHVRDFHPPPVAERILGEAFPRARVEGLWTGETVLASRNRWEIPISQVIVWQPGGIPGEGFYAVIGRDLSERKNSELREHLRGKTLEALATGAPLAVVLETLVHTRRLRYQDGSSRSCSSIAKVAACTMGPRRVCRVFTSMPSTESKSALGWAPVVRPPSSASAWWSRTLSVTPTGKGIGNWYGVPAWPPAGRSPFSTVTARSWAPSPFIIEVRRARSRRVRNHRARRPRRRHRHRKKSAEKQIQLAASVFEHSHEAIMITDAEARIVEVNRAFCELTGYSRDEVLGRNPNILKSGLHDPKFYRQIWESLLRDGHWRGEIWDRRRDHELFAAHLTISAVYGEEGAIRHYVGMLSYITQLKEQQHQLERLAHFDPLTQIPNRILLADRLQLAMARTTRSGKLLAVCYLDLDGFKPVNDRLGHAAGDQVLVQLAGRLQSALRGGDTVARLGGDEFVLLLNDLTDVHESATVLERVLELVAEPYFVQDETIVLSASIGVTLFPADASDATTLLRHADQALYLAKQSGRNRYCLFDPEQDRQARLRRETVNHFASALRNCELCLHYQPKVDLREGGVTGAEALLRWQHPQGGLLLPAEFLPALEDAEIAFDLTFWVVNTALEHMRDWRHQGLDLAVCVNTCGRTLARTGFAEELAELLTSHPEIPPRRLALEIHETTAVRYLTRILPAIEACHRLGVGIILDHFGTGPSSLAYLRQLSSDVLKIDQSLIHHMLEDNGDRMIVEGIIGLAKTFGRRVIAEGIESMEQGALLVRLGCDLVQGYAIAHPMPASILPLWIEHYQSLPRWAVSNDAVLPQDEWAGLAAHLDHRCSLTNAMLHLLRPKEETPALTSPHECQLGSWIEKSTRFRRDSGVRFQELKELHRRIHARIQELSVRPDPALVEPGLVQILTLEERLLDSLRALPVSPG